MRNELKRFLHEEAELPGRVTEASQSVGRDMEDLHQAISRSRNFRNFLRLTLNGLPDASFVMTEEGIVMKIRDTPAAEVLVGSLEGEHFSKILALFPGRHELVDQFIPTGRNAFPEALFDAGGRVYNTRWSRIHDEAGHLMSWVLRLADVTKFITPRSRGKRRCNCLHMICGRRKFPSLRCSISKPAAATTQY